MSPLKEITSVLERLWSTLTSLLPRLASALLLLIIGYVIGRIIGMIVEGLLRKFIGLDKWVRKKGLLEELYGISPSGFMAGLVKWYVYFLFIGVAAEEVGEGILTDVARALVEYSPRILASAFLVFLGVVTGAVVKRHILTYTLPSKEFLGSVMKFGTILLFALTGLSTLGIDVSLLVQTVLIFIAAILVSIGVAVGIALGLVLKDELRPYVKKFLKEILEGEKSEAERDEGMERGLYPS